MLEGLKWGYRPDPAHKRTQRLFKGLFSGAISYPQEGAIKQYAFATLNQGKTGSCGGHGSAQLTYTALAAVAQALPWVPSPAVIYGATRSIERAQTAIPGAPFPKLEDTGIMPADLTTAVTRWGVAPMMGLLGGLRVPVDQSNCMAVRCSPDGRLSDVWGPADVATINTPPNVTDEVDFEALEEAATTLIVGEYRIDEGDSAAPSLMAACIGVHKAPVGLGIFVDSAFQAWQNGMAPLDTVNRADPRGGGHWICCDHYYLDETAGQLVFELHNSWGAGWGDHGRIRVTENWIRAACMDIYPWPVTKVAS